MSVILEQAIAEERSASADRAGSRGRSDPLGATTLPGGVNFSVFSRHATGVELVLFDREDDPRPARVLPLDPAGNRTYHYRHVFVPGVEPGQLYGYRVHGPFDLGRRLRFDPAMGDEVRRTSKGTTTPWELLDFELPPAGDRGPEGWHRWIDTSLDSPQEDARTMRLRSAGCSPGGRAFPGGQQEVGHAELERLRQDCDGAVCHRKPRRRDPHLH